jgi:hypothetical protein
LDAGAAFGREQESMELLLAHGALVDVFAKCAPCVRCAYAARVLATTALPVLLPPPRQCWCAKTPVAVSFYGCVLARGGLSEGCLSGSGFSERRTPRRAVRTAPVIATTLLSCPTRPSLENAEHARARACVHANTAHASMHARGCICAHTRTQRVYTHTV